MSDVCEREGLCRPRPPAWERGHNAVPVMVLTSLAAAIACLIMAFVMAASARAETVGQYHLTMRVCVQDNGWTTYNDATLPARDQLNNAGLNVVVWDSCKTQPAGQTVIIRTQNRPDLAECATTQRGRYYADGRAADLTYINMNIAPSLKARCWSTPGQRRHLVAHELGHALGLVHRGDAPSVMNGWTYDVYTFADLSDLRGIYGVPPKRGAR